MRLIGAGSKGTGNRDCLAVHAMKKAQPGEGESDADILTKLTHIYIICHIHPTWRYMVIKETSDVQLDPTAMTYK